MMKGVNKTSSYRLEWCRNLPDDIADMMAAPLQPLGSPDGPPIFHRCSAGVSNFKLALTCRRLIKISRVGMPEGFFLLLHVLRKGWTFRISFDS
jgi:hypothetical protein